MIAARRTLPVLGTVIVALSLVLVGTPSANADTAEPTVQGH